MLRMCKLLLLIEDYFGWLEFSPALDPYNWWRELQLPPDTFAPRITGMIRKKIQKIKWCLKKERKKSNKSSSSRLVGDWILETSKREHDLSEVKKCILSPRTANYLYNFESWWKWYLSFPVLCCCCWWLWRRVEWNEKVQLLKWEHRLRFSFDVWNSHLCAISQFFHYLHNTFRNFKLYIRCDLSYMCAVNIGYVGLCFTFVSFVRCRFYAIFMKLWVLCEKKKTEKTEKNGTFYNFCIIMRVVN